MQISSTPPGQAKASGPAASANAPTATNAPAANNGQDKVKVKPAKNPPPQAAAISGGLSMAAVWASQAERRETEKAEVAAAKAKARAMPAPQVAADSSKAALRLVEDTVQVAARRQADLEKAAEKRRLEEGPKEDPFAPKEDPFAPPEDRQDPFRPESGATTQLSSTSPGLQSYQAAFAPRESDSGGTLDGRF